MTLPTTITPGVTTGHDSDHEVINDIANRALTFVDADNTGVADASVDIQAAIDALPSDGGDVVLKPGSYRLSTGLAWTRGNVRLVGQGGPGEWSAVGVGSAKLIPDAGVVAITFNGAATQTLFKAPTIERIAIVGNATSAGGILFKRASNFHLKSVTISGFTNGYGFRCDGTGDYSQYGVVDRDCSITGCLIGVDLIQCSGIGVDAYVDCAVVTNGDTPTTGAVGLQVDSGSSGCQSIGARIQGAETLIKLQGEGHSIIAPRLEVFGTAVQIGVTGATDTYGCSVIGGYMNNYLAGGGGQYVDVRSSSDGAVLILPLTRSSTGGVANAGTKTFMMFNTSVITDTGSGTVRLNMNNGSWVPPSFSATLRATSDNSIDFGAAAANRLRTLYLGTSLVVKTAQYLNGSGSPEGAITAPVGSIYTRSDGGTGSTLYVKESGTGNTGWAAK